MSGSWDQLRGLDPSHVRVPEVPLGVRRRGVTRAVERPGLPTPRGSEEVGVPGHYFDPGLRGISAKYVACLTLGLRSSGEGRSPERGKKGVSLAVPQLGE